jgi:hypothetical protein
LAFLDWFSRGINARNKKDAPIEVNAKLNKLHAAHH